jgi:hypothetical protein
MMEKDAEGFYTPASDSKPAEAQPEQDDSAYLNSFGGLGGQPQIPTRSGADQTQTRDLETDLIKSTFDVTVRRVKLLRCEVFLMQSGWTNLPGFLLGHSWRSTT